MTKDEMAKGRNNKWTKWHKGELKKGEIAKGEMTHKT